MHARKRGRAGVAWGALAVLSTVGCAENEDIAVTNAADTTVTVRFGHEDVGGVTPGGGASLLGPAGCYDGPIVVTYAQGRVVELDGPICPGQTLAVSNATATVVDTTGAD